MKRDQESLVHVMLEQFCDKYSGTLTSEEMTIVTRGFMYGFKAAMIIIRTVDKPLYAGLRQAMLEQAEHDVDVMIAAGPPPEYLS